ncbi:MAG TPA: YihY/virulence factor BrkB family protein [Candidatus Dormibacteraeota bacterium]|nr:YihY/virulence factor BrkB family protein [Candidatus Dormibacteraeota bacterium]
MTSTEHSGGFSRRIPSPLRLIGIAAWRFYQDQCLVRASALAYTSLLSIVPLLAVMFSVLKGLGAQGRLEGVLLSRLSLGTDTVDLIIGYIDKTNFGTLGALGGAALILTVISVLGNIEASFNLIWRVAQPRSWWRKVTDYVGVVMLTPFLLLAATTITSAGQAQSLMQWVLENGYLGGFAVRLLQLSPTVINTAGIAVLYAVMPNRRPASGPLLVGALFAGIAWQIAQVGYVSLQVGVARNNAIYGAVAQLPVTLVWLYVSWAVVLAGAELAAVLEFGEDAIQVPGAEREEAIALELLIRAADAFANGAGGIELPLVARALRSDLGVIQDAAKPLIARGWLLAVEDQPGRYVLGCDAARIKLADLAGESLVNALPRRIDPRVRRALGTRADDVTRIWAERTLADML